MRFRPCIDLHDGQVKQIIGGSLKGSDTPETNFATDRAASDFATLFLEDGLPGGHVIMLGPGNESQALSALRAYPEGLQVGGGIDPSNASAYLDAGASHVIVNSFVFREGRIDQERLKAMESAVGRERLVLDLSCRRRDGYLWVVTDRWQRFTEERVEEATLERLARSCDEFLVHAVDVEGKRAGLDDEILELLGEWSPKPVTYAGGAQRLEDLEQVKRLGCGRVDLTIGSALDIYGGDVPYRKVVEWQRAEERQGEGIENS